MSAVHRPNAALCTEESVRATGSPTLPGLAEGSGRAGARSGSGGLCGAQAVQAHSPALARRAMAGDPAAFPETPWCFLDTKTEGLEGSNIHQEPRPATPSPALGPAAASPQKPVMNAGSVRGHSWLCPRALAWRDATDDFQNSHVRGQTEGIEPPLPDPEPQSHAAPGGHRRSAEAHAVQRARRGRGGGSSEPRPTQARAARPGGEARTRVDAGHL